jgi:cyanate permease
MRAALALAALSLLFFILTAGTFTSLGVVLPDMVAALHWDWSRAGLGYTVLGVACGLASYGPTLVIRHLGVRTTLGLGGIVMAAGFMSLRACHSTQLYYVGAVLIGVGFALAATIPATFVLARAFTHSSTAFGIYFTAGGLGAAAGPLFYSAAKALGVDWRGYWTVLAFATLGAALLAAAVSPTVDAPDAPARPAAEQGWAEQGWSVSDALKTPQFWAITFAYTAYLLCETSVTGLSVSHLIQRGIAPAVAGGMLSLQALVNAGARAGGGVLGERVGPRNLVIGALGLTAIGIGALALARGYPLMLVYVLGVGIGYGVSYLATTVLLLNTFGRRRNLELFSIMCLVSTLAAAGPWIGGAMHDHFGGFEGAFGLFAAVAAAALLGVVLMKPLGPHVSAMADNSLP